MSSRDPGNIYPFHRDEATGTFNLEQWNEEYWRRFDSFLRATRDRDIIVELEIWATYDFYTRESHIQDGLKSTAPVRADGMVPVEMGWSDSGAMSSPERRRRVFTVPPLAWATPIWRWLI